MLKIVTVYILACIHKLQGLWYEKSENIWIKTALKVCEDKVNIRNVDVAISEFEGFCKRREVEEYGKNTLEIESVKILYKKLKEISKGNTIYEVME